MKITTRELTMMAVFTALALVLSYAESFIPSFVPGVKLGLANLIILIVLYRYRWFEGFIIDLARVLLVSLLRGTFLQLPFYQSLAGTLLSFLAMLIAVKCFKHLTPIGVSLLGAYVHALAQVAVAALFLQEAAVFFYFPIIALLAMMSGVLLGILAMRLLKLPLFAPAQ